MKNFCISLTVLSIIVVSVAAFFRPFEEKEERSEYLRIHIRANSNSDADQAVKYAVKEEIVSFVLPFAAECESKEALQNTLKAHISDIESAAEAVLAEHGFRYGAQAAVKGEEFPTRVYDGLTLEEGYYDALIVYLGSGKGDNWWCVIYPPLCFLGEKSDAVGYSSRIAEIIERWKEKIRR